MFDVATVSRPRDPLDIAALTTTVVDSLSTMERMLTAREQQLQALARAHGRVEQCYARAKASIVLLRRTHRRASHAKTSRLFKQVVDHLVALESMPQVGDVKK